MDIQAEAAKLRQLAITNYVEDGGEMAECFDQSDYEREVLEQGSAEKAWAWNLRITEVRRENGGFYEAF
jgi:hypothetical protein